MKDDYLFSVHADAQICTRQCGLFSGQQFDLETNPRLAAPATELEMGLQLAIDNSLHSGQLQPMVQLSTPAFDGLDFLDYPNVNVER